MAAEGHTGDFLGTRNVVAVTLYFSLDSKSVLLTVDDTSPYNSNTHRKIERDTSEDICHYP